MDQIVSGEFSPGARSARPWTVIGWLALLTLLAAHFVGFAVSRPERDMGHLQKIMYLHFPVALMAFLAFAVVFGASGLYLLRRDERYDLLAASAAEVGVVLTALTLALGSIWARPTWGVWWEWDPRVTTTAILLVVYVGYLALRAFTEEPEQRARWSAAVGMLAFLNVPVVYMSVRWWRSIHQVQSSPSTVAGEYAWSLRLHFIAFPLVFLYFVGQRYRAARLERAAEAAVEEAALNEGGVHV